MKSKNTISEAWLRNDSSVRAQSEINSKIWREPEALPAAPCSNILQHCITALHRIALHWIALHCIALHCNALHCIALHCIALHRIALYCIELPFVLHCIALDCIATQSSEVGHRWPTWTTALHCSIAMQHSIAAWHCLLACSLACMIARLLFPCLLAHWLFCLLASLHACSLACLPAYLPACLLPFYLLACSLPCLLAYLLADLSACLPACLLDFLLAWLLARLLHCRWVTGDPPANPTCLPFLHQANLHYYSRRVKKVGISLASWSGRWDEIMRFTGDLRHFHSKLSHVCSKNTIEIANVHWSAAKCILFFM